MPRSASLSRIEAQIEELRKKAEDIRNAVKPGIVELKAVVKKYKLSMSDIKQALVGKTKRPVSKMKGRKLKPKYRNPANKKETWAGRGREPKWFSAAIKAGKKPEQLAI